MIWDNDFAVSVIPLLLEGLWVTVKITLLGTLLAAALGLFFAILRRLAIVYGAYMAEVYRSGIQGVPKGQWEAATALSLPGARTWSRIILPQAIRTVVPMLGNYLIQMFKDSAVLSAITVVELMATAQAIGSSSFRYLEPLTLAALLFLAISYPASRLVNRLERRYAPQH